MRRDDLTATAWFASRAFAVGLGIAGLFLVFRPEWLGWSWLADLVGGDMGLIAALAGLAFLVAARQTLQVHDLRVHSAATLEALHDLLYGKDHRRDREAIGVLLTSLRSEDRELRDVAHKHLKRLTGQEFAADADVWDAWWKAHEHTWSRRTPDAS